MDQTVASSRLTAFVSFERTKHFSPAALVLVQPMKTGNHPKITEKKLIVT